VANSNKQGDHPPALELNTTMPLRKQLPMLWFFRKPGREPSTQAPTLCRGHRPRIDKGVVVAALILARREMV
jgi:hypothetical protein